MKIALLLAVCWGFVCFGCGEENSTSKNNTSVSPPDAAAQDHHTNGSEDPNSIESDGPNHHGDSASYTHHGPKAANDMMAQSEFEELLSFFESEDRASWQKPDSIVALLGDIENKVVMDLGAGSGYFAFRLLEAGAHVIAAEVDDRFINYLTDKRDSMVVSDLEFEIRKVFFDDPLLTKDEADVFFTVDTYHHIERRVEYLKKVFKGMKGGGKLVIVDFKKKTSPHGPPLGIRLHPDVTIKEVLKAGFVTPAIDSTTLPEQYILQAIKPVAP